MAFVRCRISFALLRSCIVCLTGSRTLLILEISTKNGSTRRYKSLPPRWQFQRQLLLFSIYNFFRALLLNIRMYMYLCRRCGRIPKGGKKERKKKLSVPRRDRWILLEKVADSVRKAVKLAEPYKPYGGQFLEFCSISFSTYQTCMKLTRKSTEFCQFFCRQNPLDPSAPSR